MPSPPTYLQKSGVCGIQLGITLHLWVRGTRTITLGCLMPGRSCPQVPPLVPAPCWPGSHVCPCAYKHGCLQSLTTPSSAGALSPTTNITGQLEMRGGNGSQGSGWAPCPGRCLCSSYRSVLALGTVPGRLMSRSLRLEERESQCEHVGRHRAGLCPQNGSVEPCCPSTQ